MSAYCTAAQIALQYNTNEVTDFADDDADGTADTGVVAAIAAHASQEIWSYIYARYSGTTAMDPANYTAGDGTYPILEYKAAILAKDLLRMRQGGPAVALSGREPHPVIRWAQEVRLGLADVHG